MRFRLSPRTKRDLANRVTYNYFLRLLIFKVWFRTAVLAFGLLLVVLVLVLPKIWTVSPPDLRPPVRVSGIDLVESWRSKQTARHEMRAGRFQQSHYAWMAALANNPVDLEALRGILRNLLTPSSNNPDALHDAIVQSAWLLRLSHTNRADLELATDAFLNQDRSDLVLDFLAPVQDLTPHEKANDLKALFRAQQMDEFGSNWIRLGADQLTDPELPLYHAAYILTLNHREEVPAARQVLLTAMQEPSHSVLANQLQLRLPPEQNDPVASQRCIAQLTALQHDTALDHVAYWCVLAEHGQLEKAKELAALYQQKPKTAEALVDLAKGFEKLGMSGRAIQSFEASGTDFPDSEQVWAAYGSLLARRKAWDDLRSLAVRMRATSQVHEALVGYSYFLEGWAEAGQERQQPAEAAFSKMNEFWSGSSRLTLKTAKTLLDLHFTGAARQLLAQAHEVLQSNSQYRTLLIRASTEPNESEMIPSAAR